MNTNDFDLSNALTMTQAAQRIRGRARARVSRAVVNRWATRGYAPRGWIGERLKLATLLIGSTRYTMPAWLEEFDRRRVAMGQPSAEKMPTECQASASHRRAVDRLTKAGVMDRPKTGAA